MRRTSSLLTLMLSATALSSVAGVLAPSPARAASLSISGTVRDFTPYTNPDFEHVITDDRGIVQTWLGVDGKPVYNAANVNPTIHSAATFDQWYRDVSGVNISYAHAVTLTNSSSFPGVYTYSSSAFYPLDGRGFGNYYAGHNYHFTYELSTWFTYQGGERFSFTGDDDLWVFINGVLAVDIGGIHGAESTTISLDALAASLGITPGGTYSFHLFFAERHTVASEFRIDTSIEFQPEICFDGRDNDSDGRIDAADPDCQICGDGDIDPGEQCDDGNSRTGDGCTSACVDEDQDGDGHGDDGYGGGDCDDTRADVYPGAYDAPYDGLDADCDGGSDDDGDGDGHDDDGHGGDDCDDSDPDVHPGAYDAPYDGLDADCGGGSDDDGDGDGHDDDGHGGDDCDDSDPDVYPGAYDAPYDGLDADCGGGSDNDGDGDGHDDDGHGGGDCDDGNASVSPDGAEGGTSAPYAAASVISASQGRRRNNLPVVPMRSDPLAGLDYQSADIEGVFYSMGFGGSIEVEFACPLTDGAGDDLLIYEKTYGAGSAYPEEAAEVYAWDGGQWVLLGGATNLPSSSRSNVRSRFDLGGLTGVTRVRIVDTSDVTLFDNSADGFDLNGVYALHDCLTACDGLDNDCDGTVDDGQIDSDGDGTCDSADIEVCDGLDNDGDGGVDEGLDYDGDGVANCFDIEICDGLDNDGDSSVDEGFDADSDGFADCSETCEVVERLCSGDGETLLMDGSPAVRTWDENRRWTARIDGASWIWDEYLESDPENDQVRSFFRDLPLQSGATDLSATMEIAADNSYEMWLNGDAVGADATEFNYFDAGIDGYDLTPFLDAGENLLEMEVRNWGRPGTTSRGNPGGLLYCIDVSYSYEMDAESCNGVDDDCDGITDEDQPDLDSDDLCDGIDSDADGDGADAADMGGDDCDDADAGRTPGATEIDADGIDQDCTGADNGVDTDGDGFSDEEEVAAGTDPLRPDNADRDGDGHDDDRFGGDDCDDTRADVYPGAPEVWYDGVDQGCDGGDDNDQDGDGFAVSWQGGTDCDDTDGDAYPGSPEFNDGVDNDCNGLVEEGDLDGDGVLTGVEAAVGSDWTTPDTDGDGVWDGDEIGDDPSHPLDTDGDGRADWEDSDDDGDGIGTVDEIGGYDATDRSADLPDLDGDGDPDHRDSDADGDGYGDADEGQIDTDGDGAADFQDGDDDGDGLPTLDERQADSDRDGDADPDADGDGTPNDRDSDSDNDGRDDAAEGLADQDGDGVADFVDPWSPVDSGDPGQGGDGGADSADSDGEDSDDQEEGGEAHGHGCATGVEAGMAGLLLAVGALRRRRR